MTDDEDIWESDLESHLQRWLKYDTERQVDLYEMALRTVHSLEVCSNCDARLEYCIVCGMPR